MYVERYGRGQQIYVALHGWAGSHRDFLPIVRHLPAYAKLIAPDLPGHGQSPPPAGWSESDVVGQLGPLLQEGGGQPVTLVGFCSGAALALLMAERAPEQVARLVMIDPFAFVPWYFRLFLAGSFGRMAYRTTFATTWGRAITSGFLRVQQASPEDFAAAFQNVDHDVALKWLAFFASIGRPKRFAGLQMAVDILCGEKTFRAVIASVREYTEALPQSRVQRLSGLGHLPLARGAQQIADIVWGRADACLPTMGA